MMLKGFFCFFFPLKFQHIDFNDSKHGLEFPKTRKRHNELKSQVFPILKTE